MRSTSAIYAKHLVQAGVVLFWAALGLGVLQALGGDLGWPWVTGGVSGVIGFALGRGHQEVTSGEPQEGP